MTQYRHLAIIDIGKTNAKLALVDLEAMRETAGLKTPNSVQPGPPNPHMNLERLWGFIGSGLAQLHREHGIDAISATTHGASAVLLDAQGGLATPMLDYEFDGPDDLAGAYDALQRSRRRRTLVGTRGVPSARLFDRQWPDTRRYVLLRCRGAGLFEPGGGRGCGKPSRRTGG